MSGSGSRSRRRIYKDRIKDKEVNLAIDAHEKAAQRAAAEAREWWIFVLRQHFGWSTDDVERFVVKGEFTDGPSARRALEEGKPDELAALKDLNRRDEQEAAKKKPKGGKR